MVCCFQRRPPNHEPPAPIGNKGVYARIGAKKNLAVSEEHDSLFQIGKQVLKPLGTQCGCNVTLYLSPQWKCLLHGGPSLERQRNHVRPLVFTFAADY